MADIGQSPFLQSLGWATLNSFWQWAALWCLFLCVQSIFKLSSQKKYTLAVLCMAGGVVWYLITFINHFTAESADQLFLAYQSWAPSTITWNLILSAASITYLVLFIFPLYHFYKNWQYINRVRHYGLHKADLEQRLFVSRISALLGIGKKVQLYVSDLVSSPITLGFLKPIILLPLSAINNLSVKQTEAILLHELSHIKRYDYLLNVVITFIGTVFYFNPFIKKFISVIEAEREACCDDLVLQFEYDRISYASALYLLEQNNTPMELLTIAAAKKKHLLARIKKIVGIKEKSGFTFNHFAGLCASFLLVLVLNTLFIASKENGKAAHAAFSPLENSVFAFTNNKEENALKNNEINISAPGQRSVATSAEKPLFHATQRERSNTYFFPAQSFYADKNLTAVAFDDVEASVSEEQKNHIKTTLNDTKKVLTTLQWKEVEKSIADGMTMEEKEVAKTEYMNEVDKVNWSNLEENLKAGYDKINWEKINNNLATALVTIKLDSIQTSYTTVLKEIEKAQKASTCNVQQPLPDASVKEVIQLKNEIRLKLDSLKVIRNKKVISL